MENLINNRSVFEVIPYGLHKRNLNRGRLPKHRRLVVEVAHPWFNRFRKLIIRYEMRSALKAMKPLFILLLPSYVGGRLLLFGERF